MNTGMIPYTIFYTLLLLICLIGGLFGRKILSTFQRKRWMISIDHFDEACNTDILLEHYRYEQLIDKLVKHAVDGAEKEPLSVIEAFSCIFVWLLPQIFKFDSETIPTTKLDQYIVTQMEILIRKYAQQYDITDPRIVHGTMYIKRDDTLEEIRRNCYILLLAAINPYDHTPTRIAVNPVVNWLAYNGANLSVLDITPKNVRKLIKWISSGKNYLISVRRATEDDEKNVENDPMNNISIQYVEEGSVDGQ